MQNFDSPENTLLYITSDVGSNGTVSMPGSGWSQTFSIAANGSVEITIPSSENAAIATSFTVLNRAIHIVSDTDVAVYAANQRTASSDATLVMPNHALGDSYVVNTYTPFSSGNPAMFVVVGIEDNTSITIVTPAAATYNITLNQGEVYMVSSSSDLTGSTVNATDIGVCNNFAVFAGVKCAEVPSCTYCDHLYEQMIPLKAWGQEFVTVPLMTRDGDQYRILACEDNTIININGGPNITLNAGDFHEEHLTPACFIEGDKPISVAQYSRGTGCDGVTSDPFMIMLSPVEQTLDYIVFQAFNTAAINQFYTNIVCETSSTGSVQLDGSAVAGWATVPSNASYSFVQKNIAQGTHVLTSPEGILASVYGFGNVESYGYLAGANLQPLNVDYQIIIGNDSISYDIYQDTLDCEESANGVDFTTNADNISNVHFDFGDGNTATGTSVFHQYVNSGTYTVTMYFTRDGSCVEEELSMLVHVSNSLPPFDFINDTLICNGSPFVINPNVTGVNFLWQDNSTGSTYTVSNSGTYSLTISDTQGCSASATADVTFINLSVSITEIPITCAGVSDGELTATQSGGTVPISYVWNTSPAQTTQTITSLGVGSYTVTVTDNNTCTATNTISLTMPPSLSISHTDIIDETCFGLNNGSANIVTNGGTAPYTIAWNPASVYGFTPINLSPNTYAYTVTDNFGCYGTGVFDINAATEISVNITSINAGCFGEPISASVSAFGGANPLSIEWADGSTSFNNDNIPSNTNFGFTVTDANNCSEPGTVHLTAPDELLLNTNSSDVICKGDANGTIQIEVIGGIGPYINVWNNGEMGNNLNNLEAGFYSVTVTDANNCTVSEDFLIREAAQELEISAITRDVTCFGYNDGAILLIATGGIYPYTYESIGVYDSFSGTTQNAVPAGIFTSIVTDVFGCISDTILTINEPEELIGQYITTDPSCIGNNDGSIEIIISGGVEPYYYMYGAGIIDIPFISRLYEGMYEIEVYDTNNCVLNMGVALLEDLPVDCIKIPNAFTPNGDNINDTFIIEGMEIFSEAILYIYNRWGQPLYIGVTGDDFWDGKYEGKLVPTGTYIYILDLRNGMPSYKGPVTIVH